MQKLLLYTDKYKAKVAELAGAYQANGSKMGVPKQEEALNLSRQSWRMAMQADTAHHPNWLKQRRTGKVTEHPDKCASAKTSKDTKLHLDATEQVDKHQTHKKEAQ